MSTAALPDPRQSKTAPLTSDNANVAVKVIESIASMKLTIVLFLLSMVIVFVGSLAQAQKDVWDVVNQYFRTWVAWIDIKDCFPPSMFPTVHKDGLFGGGWEQLGALQTIPFPGGWAIGMVMFANLFAAHALRFRIRAGKSQLASGGVLLALGGLATFAVVINGNAQNGVEAFNWWLSSTAIWNLMLITLACSVIGCFAAAALLKSASGTARVIYAGSGVLLGVLLIAGIVTGEINLSSMRILWQLLKGTACAAIVLAGSLLWFGKRGGVVVIHVGVALLMISELLVGMNAEENQLRLAEGDTLGYLRDIRERELAVVVRKDDKQRTVTVPDWMIQEAALEGGEPIAVDNLPFLIQVDKYAKNSNLRPLLPGEDRPAEKGTASFAVIQEVPPQDGMASDIDWGAVQFSLLDPDSKDVLQTIVCAQEISEGRLVPIAEQANVGGQAYDFYYRFQRNYRDYKVELLDVSRTNYIGSSTAKDYRSKIRITDNKTDQTDEYEVWMNNPLRYNGETFYQSDYNPGSDGKEITMLSVVKNDGWMLPYIACMFVAVGMLAQFGVTLTRFLNKTERSSLAGSNGDDDSDQETEIAESKLPAGIRQAAATEETFLDSKDPLQNSPWPVVMPVLVCLLAATWVGMSWKKSKSQAHDPLTMNLKGFSALPVAWRGRSQPMDSFARVQMLMASHKSTFKGELAAEELAHPEKRAEIIEAVSKRWPNAKTGELIDFNGEYVDWVEKIKQLTGSGDKLVEETVRDVMVARMPAVRWMLDVIARPELAERHRVIRIQDDQLLNKLKLEQRHGQLYSLSEFRQELPGLRDIHQAGLKLQDSTAKHEMTDLQRRTVSLFNTVRNIDSMPTMFRQNEEFGLVGSLVESWWLLERLGDTPAVMAVPTNIDDPQQSWETMLAAHAISTAMKEIEAAGVSDRESLLTYVESELPKRMLTSAIAMNQEFMEKDLTAKLKRQPTSQEIAARAREAVAGISREDVFLRETLLILADAEEGQSAREIVESLPEEKMRSLAQERMSADLFRIARELENQPNDPRLKKLRADLRSLSDPDSDNLIQVSNRLFLQLVLTDLEEHIGGLLYDSEKSETYQKASDTLATIFTAWQRSDVDNFNSGVKDYADYLKSNSIAHVDQKRVTAEASFNEFDPFWKAIYLYLPVMLLSFAGWLFFPTVMYRTGFWLMAAAFAVHTFGLIMRIWISGRPPVTNLYSSAIFIGWGVVLASFIVEVLVSNGLGNLLGSVTGAASLVIAHYLAIDEGDTMGVMVAVLDTTFWLATHVVCITLGYAATFLAGFLGLTYVAVKVLEPLTGTLTIRSRKRDKKTAQEGRSFLTAVKDVGHSVLTAGISGTRLGPPRKLTDVLGASVYGTICFAIFFSLVGTVLGGLWADDSWGRFWGWDPKENGAMLIVIWNAVILHARWDKMVRDYGVAVLAMIGNIVTAWSWFGVNELSAGLHNYGFTEGRLLALATFVGVQAAIVLAASANGWWKKQSSMA